MNSKILIISIIATLSLSVFTVFLPIETSEAAEAGNTIYVDDEGGKDYTSIQDAIDATNLGDTIYVYNGTYYENINIYKSIDLTGEDKDNTIIDGGIVDNVIIITADEVNITGFTIQNSGDVFPNAGINITSNYNTISGNNMTNNFYGIIMFQASNNIISMNTIQNNDHCGIYMSGSSNNIISGNTIGYHQYNGIGIYDASNSNTITENTLAHNNYSGINICISSNNNIIGNTITYNNIGIRIPSAKYENQISNNIFSNNNNNIEKQHVLPTFEMMIAIIVIVAAGGIILFWKQKRQKISPTSKDKKQSLDTRGNLCPIPLIMTKKKITKMKKDEVLEIITNDIVARENIERYGREKYELIRIDKEGELFKIYIKK